MAKSRAIDDFIELMLHQGWAAAPKSQVAGWYDQKKFSKGIVTDLKQRAEDPERYGSWAEECIVYETPTGHVLLVKDMYEWKTE